MKTAWEFLNNEAPKEKEMSAQEIEDRAKYLTAIENPAIVYRDMQALECKVKGRELPVSATTALSEMRKQMEIVEANIRASQEAGRAECKTDDRYERLGRKAVAESRRRIEHKRGY